MSLLTAQPETSAIDEMFAGTRSYVAGAGQARP